MSVHDVQGIDYVRIGRDIEERPWLKLFKEL